MALRLSPFGMETCCVCDAPTTRAIREGDELLPYCSGCASETAETFPEVRVLIYDPATKKEI